MFDTYFKQCTTRSEVRKRRNSLAKQLHPDLGGNEEEMKILNAECERRLQEITENEPQNGTITVESRWYTRAFSYANFTPISRKVAIRYDTFKFSIIAKKFSK